MHTAVYSTSYSGGTSENSHDGEVAIIQPNNPNSVHSDSVLDMDCQRTIGQKKFNFYHPYAINDFTVICWECRSINQVDVQTSFCKNGLG